MTTNNYTGLREKALAATQEERELTRYEHGGGRLFDAATKRILIADLFNEGDREFIAATSPSTILALLDDLQTANDKATELQERIDKALAVKHMTVTLEETWDWREAHAILTALTPKEEG